MANPVKIWIDFCESGGGLKMNRRIAALILPLAFLLAVLAACGAEQGSPEFLSGFDSIYSRMTAQQLISQNWKM